MRRAALIARRARTWLLRVLASFFAITGFMPQRLQLEWWYWALESLDPQHPHIAHVLAEICRLEDCCRA